MNDATTAFLAFAITFVGFAFYLWRLEARTRRIEATLRELEKQAEGQRREGAL